MGPGYSFDRLYTDSVWFDSDIPIFSSLIVGFGSKFQAQVNHSIQLTAFYLAFMRTFGCGSLRLVFSWKVNRTSTVFVVCCGWMTNSQGCLTTGCPFIFIRSVKFPAPFLIERVTQIWFSFSFCEGVVKSDPPFSSAHF